MPSLHAEPTLEDILSDPMVLALMERDGVEPDVVRRFVRDIRRSQHALAQQAAARPRPHHGKEAPV